MLNICEQPIMGNNKNTILLQIDVEYSVQSGNKNLTECTKWQHYGMATFYSLLFTIWQQKGKLHKKKLVQSGNKKF